MEELPTAVEPDDLAPAERFPPEDPGPPDCPPGTMLAVGYSNPPVYQCVPEVPGSPVLDDPALTTTVPTTTVPPRATAFDAPAQVGTVPVPTAVNTGDGTTSAMVTGYEAVALTIVGVGAVVWYAVLQVVRRDG